jgi:hypothetical protein
MIVDTYGVRVTVGHQWYVQLDDELDVLIVDRLARIETATRAWIAERRGVLPDSFAINYEFIHR